MKKIFWLAAIAVLVSACVANGPAKPAPTAENAGKAIAAAEAAADKADAVGFQWRDTADIIKKAKAAAQANNFAAAIDLANQAEREGNAAYAQYQRETARMAKH